MAIEDDRLFCHLQELMDLLPDMQRAHERLRQHRQAAPLARLAERARADSLELRHVDDELEKIEQLRAAAGESGDRQEYDRLDRLKLFWGNQRGYRIGPARNSAEAFETACEQRGFSSADEVRDALLAPEERTALEQRLSCYRRDYERTLAACEKIEGDAPSSSGRSGQAAARMAFSR